MDATFERWFDARALYADGVPSAVHTALSVFPNVRGKVAAAIAASKATSALEVGPGTVPLVSEIDRRVYLDVARGFLEGLDGSRVIADARSMPFSRGSFDLVVLSDVLTHVPPGERGRVLREAVRVAGSVLVFNPEPGTPEVEGSAVPTAPIISALRSLGLEVGHDTFKARAKGRPDFPMTLVTASRRTI